jgi:hypothetical protein
MTEEYEEDEDEEDVSALCGKRASGQLAIWRVSW